MSINMKNKFILPPNKIYLTGHSLGPSPIQIKETINKTIDDWNNLAINAWNEAEWLQLPIITANKIATILSAEKGSIAVCDSTSINLYKLIVSALKLNKKRNTILTTDDNFPSDSYIMQGIKKFDPSVKLKIVNPKDLIESLTDDISVLSVTHISYRSGNIIGDIEEITNIAKKKNILTVWDLSHTTGIFPINLSELDVDFAVGCTYKYLNGGPGSQSYIYINPKHIEHVSNPISGWLGHKNPFEFDPEYKESHNINKFFTGTPSILSLASLNASLDIFNNIKIKDIYKESQKLTDKLLEYLNSMKDKIEIKSDIDPNKRGGHISFKHHNGYVLSRILIENNIICDYREPGIIRLCPNPLYISSDDVDKCIMILTDIFKDPEKLNTIKYTRKEVT